MLSIRFGDVFRGGFETVSHDTNRIRFETETASHDNERQYESNTVRNSHRRTKEFVCLPDFISTHAAMLSERFGDVLCAFSECFESQNGAISTHGLPMMRK